MGRLYLRWLLLPRYPRLRFPGQKAKNPLQKPLVFTFLCNYLAFILRFLQRVAPLAPRIKNREGLTMAHNESKPSGGRFTVRMIAENSIIAAIYVALTLLVPVLSFGPIQCRFSEALVLLCFWRPDITIGLTIGCLISNGIGAALTINPAIDMLIGTSATLFSCLLISFFSKRLCIACIWPVLFNGIIVGSELYFMGFASDTPLWMSCAFVAAGEAVAMAAGYALWAILAHMKFFNTVFMPTRHQDVKW